MSDEEVRTEAHHAAHGVGIVVEDGTVDVARRDVAEPGPSQRTIGQAERFGALILRQHLRAADIRHLGRREEDVPPSTAKLPVSAYPRLMARAGGVEPVCCSTPLHE